jgi:hypothetical protein
MNTIHTLKTDHRNIAGLGMLGKTNQLLARAITEVEAMEKKAAVLPDLVEASKSTLVFIKGHKPTPFIDGCQCGYCRLDRALALAEKAMVAP